MIACDVISVECPFPSRIQATGILTCTQQESCDAAVSDISTDKEINMYLKNSIIDISHSGISATYLYIENKFSALAVVTVATSSILAPNTSAIFSATSGR